MSLFVHHETFKGHSQPWDRANLGTSFSHFEKSSPQPEIKANLKFRFNLRSVSLDFHSFCLSYTVVFFIIFG